jgi:putative acetyltransferase
MVAAVYVGGCGGVPQYFVCVRADRTVCRQSAYPLAIDSAKVGKYAAKAKSGAGYFYDDVLEYRVWFCPERGAKPLNGKDDYYVAFAEYERAEELSRASRGAEEPLVLVMQYEWINEPEPGHYQAEKGKRITEWQVEWLEGSKRTPDSTRDFLNLLKERVSRGTVLTKKNNAPGGRRNS